MPPTVVSGQAARRRRGETKAKRSIHTTCSSLSASVSGHTLHGKLILCNARATKCPNVVRMPSCQRDLELSGGRGEGEGSCWCWMDERSGRRAAGQRRLHFGGQCQVARFPAVVGYATQRLPRPTGFACLDLAIAHFGVSLGQSSGSAYVCIPFWHFCT